jgi:hypothetical protein
MVANLRLLVCVVFFILEVNSSFLFSQSIDYFNGKVIDSKTSKPVAFATVKLKVNQLGVYANADGDFRIYRNTRFQTDSIIITCIGFKRYSIAVKDLSENTVNRINLTPSIYGLREVKVTASRRNLNSAVIISRAIRKIPDNYPVKPFNYISYYRDYQKKDSNYINLNEAIVQTRDTGFTSESVLNKYKLLDFRKNTDFPRMNISPYYSIEPDDINRADKTIPYAILGDQKGNELFILMVHDAIRNFKTGSFSYINTFSKDFLNNHNFSEPVTVLNNNLLLYKIVFSGDTGIIYENLQVSGAIYIQPKDYSIHKLEYSCYYKNKGERIKPMFNINIEYGYENSVDSRMCLKYISFNNFFKVVDLSDDTYLRLINWYWSTERDVNPCLVLNFNNFIDPQSASEKNNYDIRSFKKPIKIIDIQVENRFIYLRLKGSDYPGRRDSTLISIRNIKDINGNILNKRKSIELFQYRELFVQEYNKSFPSSDSCYMQHLPLEQNCISKYSGNFNYWMNTPENIKIVK